MQPQSQPKDPSPSRRAPASSPRRARSVLSSMFPSLAARAGISSEPAATVSAPLHVDAPALLVEARFGDVTLATRLLRADLPGAFTIGAARDADAPVNPAWL